MLLNLQNVWREMPNTILWTLFHNKTPWRLKKHCTGKFNKDLNQSGQWCQGRQLITKIIFCFISCNFLIGCMNVFTVSNSTTSQPQYNVCEWHWVPSWNWSNFLLVFPYTDHAKFDSLLFGQGQPQHKQSSKC